MQEEVAQVSCLCRRQDVSREKKSFSLTMGIPSSFLMGVSAIDVSVVYYKRKWNILWNVRVFRGMNKELKQQPRPI